MSDHAYDISYLLDSEPAKVDMPELRIVRTPPPSATATATASAAAAAAIASVAAAQQAMASELMMVDPVHEALIQQYLRMSGSSFLDTDGQ